MNIHFHILSDRDENLLISVCFLLSGILTAINCISVRWAMRIQSVFTAAKLFALALIILAGLYHLFSGKYMSIDLLIIIDFKLLITNNIDTTQKEL